MQEMTYLLLNGRFASDIIKNQPAFCIVVLIMEQKCKQTDITASEYS
jgi:hypothetical protein